MSGQYLLRRHRRAKGFSLIELMVTLAVLAILIGVGVPSFQGMIANSRIAAASNDVVSGMYAAKSEAIKRNDSIRFCINPTTKAWQVLDLAGTAIKVGEVHSSVGVNTNGLDTTSVADNACVRFKADGLSYGATNLITAGTVTLSLAGVADTVINVRVGVIHAG
tara:strand:+ start:45346 stop:45837 length:492 start_codon:yes stop_codon:yes gene_type:complete